MNKYLVLSIVVALASAQTVPELKFPGFGVRINDSVFTMLGSLINDTELDAAINEFTATLPSKFEFGSIKISNFHARDVKTDSSKVGFTFTDGGDKGKIKFQLPTFNHWDIKFDFDAYLLYIFPVWGTVWVEPKGFSAYSLIEFTQQN